MRSAHYWLHYRWLVNLLITQLKLGDVNMRRAPYLEADILPSKKPMHRNNVSCDARIASLITQTSAFSTSILDYRMRCSQDC